MTEDPERRVARGVYRAIVYLALPLAFAYFFWRGRREPAYRQRWRERLGHGEHMAGQPFWIHAASVGEVTLAEPLVRALHDRHPQRPIIVTTFTPTGAQRVRERLADMASHSYLPLDTMAATRRFMRRVQPSCGIIIETELWPNLLRAAARAGVPVLLANASISERSAQRYGNRWLVPLMRATMADITAIGAANPAHAGRFRTLGANSKRVVVTGNLKYDLAPNPQAPAQGVALRRHWQAQQRPLWIAASTHAGEDEAVLAAHYAIQRACPDALLVLAPRHPQRFSAVADLLQEQGWRYANFAADAVVEDSTEVILGNTLGDVPRFYAAADAVFVGGSLVAGIGGHNLLEAALLARPLTTGAHITEWQEVADILGNAGGAAIVDGPQQLAAQLLHWLTNPDAAQRAGRNARQAALAEGGALQRTLGVLADLLK